MSAEEINRYGLEFVRLVRRRAEVSAEYERLEDALRALVNEALDAGTGELYSLAGSDVPARDVGMESVRLSAASTAVFARPDPTACPGSAYCSWAHAGSAHEHGPDGEIWSSSAATTAVNLRG